MSKFNLNFFKIILEAKSILSSQIKKLEAGLNEINHYLSITNKSNPDYIEYEKLKAAYEEKLKFYRVPVKVTCYDKTEIYPSAAEAIEYFKDRFIIL